MVTKSWRCMTEGMMGAEIVYECPTCGWLSRKWVSYCQNYDEEHEYKSMKKAILIPLVNGDD